MMGRPITYGTGRTKSRALMETRKSQLGFVDKKILSHLEVFEQLVRTTFNCTMHK